ncbi:hypothetical protein AHF37_00359 [Paragonimus kellicotti]|nr:hypothetical protein AHF37_00359 [Paragonimus kellicotti]
MHTCILVYNLFVRLFPSLQKQYGPFGHNCGIGFASRKDLITHVMDTHLIFGEQKSVMCRWGGGRCRTRFTDTKSIKAISDHLLTHIPD